LHIHLQLMEREVRKLRRLAEERKASAPVSKGGRLRPITIPADNDAADVGRKLEQYVGVAKGEINRLDYIITQFLHAIRPTAPQLKPASLNEVVHKTLELLKPELENRGLHVKTRLARQLPSTPIDATQIQQSLLTLIKNAMHA